MPDPLASHLPQAPDLPAELASLDAASLRDGRTWSEALVCDAELSGLEAGALSAIGSRLERVDLGGARLPGLRMVDVVLSAGNLANVRARGASLVRCELRGCRLTGSSWAEARMNNVLRNYS